jgi:hypothetical protein
VNVTATVHPQSAADIVVRAVARRSQTVALFVEPSSQMLYTTRSIAALEDAGDLYARITTH